MIKVNPAGRLVVYLGLTLICAGLIYGQRTRPHQMERLSRGMIVVSKCDGKVFISWRLLGTDPDDIAFNLYRKTAGANSVRLNTKPIDNVTFFIDNADLTKSNSYQVRATIKKKEQSPNCEFVLNTDTSIRQYFSISLQTPEGHTPNDASAL